MVCASLAGCGFLTILRTGRSLDRKSGQKPTSQRTRNAKRHSVTTVWTTLADHVVLLVVGPVGRRIPTCTPAAHGGRPQRPLVAPPVPPEAPGLHGHGRRRRGRRLPVEPLRRRQRGERGHDGERQRKQGRDERGHKDRQWDEAEAARGVGHHRERARVGELRQRRTSVYGIAVSKLM